MRIQVQKFQIDEAKAMLKDVGFLVQWKDHLKKFRRNQPDRKWIFIFFGYIGNNYCRIPCFVVYEPITKKH